MEKIKLNENVLVSPIVQGLWRLTDWNWTIAETVEFIEQCIALGVTTLDTAEIYGNYACEERVGEVLRFAPHLRDHIEASQKPVSIWQVTNGHIPSDTTIHANTESSHPVRKASGR